MGPEINDAPIKQLDRAGKPGHPYHYSCMNSILPCVQFREKDVRRWTAFCYTPFNFTKKMHCQTDGIVHSKKKILFRSNLTVEKAMKYIEWYRYGLEWVPEHVAFCNNDGRRWDCVAMFKMPAVFIRPIRLHCVCQRTVGVSWRQQLCSAAALCCCWALNRNTI